MSDYIIKYYYDLLIKIDTDTNNHEILYVDFFFNKGKTKYSIQ